MKSYPDRLAELLANAPPVPPFKRIHELERAGVSEETKAKLIMLHAAYATFGHRLDHLDRTV